MDKNTVTGLALIAAIMLGFFWFTDNKQKEARKERAHADSVYRATHPVTAAPDSAFTQQTPQLTQAAATATADSVLSGQIGYSLVESMKGEEQFYTLENKLVKLTFSNLGGRVAAAELKEYKSYAGEPLVLFGSNPADSKFDLAFYIRNAYGDAPVNTSKHYFTTTADAVTVATDGERSLSMRLPVDSAAYVEFLYTLGEESYKVDMKVNFVGMQSHLANQGDVQILWENVSNQNEKGFENENNYTDLQYKYPGETNLEKLGMSKSSRDEQDAHKIKWVAFKQQFFSSILVAGEAFEGGTLHYDTYLPGTGHVKKFSAKLSMPFNFQVGSYDLSYYFGPNKYSVLKKQDEGFEKLVPLGWGIFGWINRFIVIPVFDLLSRSIASFGLIILLLTIFIKIIIAPMTYKSYISMAKMRLLKPEIDEIGKKYPKQDEAMKKQQATMELYKRAGVSPMGGCVPLLIQMPILIAMFRFFPAAIELRQEAFLWADDLSSYDSILNLPFNIPFYGDHVSLFTLLMAVMMYFSARMTTAQTAAGPQMAGMKFMSLYLMPLMMMMWFNNYASGLSYYYSVSTLITIGQTYAFRYAVDDKKLHAQMKANAKKPKKKSKWTERYEQILKDQQAQQKAVAAQRAKKK